MRTSLASRAHQPATWQCGEQMATFVRVEFTGDDERTGDERTEEREP